MIKFFTLLLLNIFDSYNQSKIFTFLKKRGYKDFQIFFDVWAHKGESILLYLKNFNISKNFKKKSNYILFPLSQNKDSSYELLNCVKILSNKLKNTNYKLIIKPHPNFEIKHFLSKLEMKLLPENVKISNKDLDALLSECLFSIILSTYSL